MDAERLGNTADDLDPLVLVAVAFPLDAERLGNRVVRVGHPGWGVVLLSLQMP